MLRRPSCAIAVVLPLLVGSAAYAQTGVPENLGAPAHISVVQGSATLERNGIGEPAAENLPLLEGDRLRTEVGRPIRADDLRTLAVIYDQPPGVLTEQLITWGVLNPEARRAVPMD